MKSFVASSKRVGVSEELLSHCFMEHLLILSYDDINLHGEIIGAALGQCFDTVTVVQTIKCGMYLCGLRDVGWINFGL